MLQCGINDEVFNRTQIEKTSGCQSDAGECVDSIVWFKPSCAHILKPPASGSRAGSPIAWIKGTSKKGLNLCAYSI